MRSIAVVTVSRSDYGIYLPILRKIQQDPDLHLHLIVGGMHVSPEFGLTAQMIERDGFIINERIEMLLSSDTPEGIAKSMGLGMIGFAQAHARFRPDLLLVLGDRFEMFSAVAASLPFNIPVAHIHGGESTEGLIDESIRHSITKMSHLHFVSTRFHAERVIHMGEEPWRVTISGAPSLDNLHHMSVFSREELQTQFGLQSKDPFLLVTYHPVTLEYEQTEMHLRELFLALERVPQHIFFTSPNADTRGRLVLEMIRDFASRHKRAQIADNLGTQGYFSLMNYAAAMVGNSSSGIVEAASFKLPVVNIGNRQRGRVHANNVIDVGYGHDQILAGIKRALSPDLRDSLSHLINPYGDGRAAERIVAAVKQINLDDRLLLKRFYDMGDQA